MRILCSIVFLVVALRAEPNVAVTRVERAPRVDGRLTEEAWQRTPVSSFGTLEHVHEGYRESWSGTADLSCRVRALLAGDALYLAFEVRDDVLIHKIGNQWWNGDSIELFFDTDRTDDGSGGFSNDDFQLFLLPFHEELRWGVVARGPDKPYPTGGLSGLEVERTRVEGGYVLEVRLPLWNLAPLRPDAQGRIGFDIALNDVDTPGAQTTETYLTFSGRFDLYKSPGKFGTLELGPVAEASPIATVPATGADWTGLSIGLAALVVLAFAARRISNRIARSTRPRAMILCAAFAGAGVLLAFLPAIVSAVDENRTRDRWQGGLDRAEAAAIACLDMDTEGQEARARHVLALLRDGRVRVGPRFDYECVPVTDAARRGPPDARSPGPTRYGIEVGAGQTRTFPLPGILAPQHIRIDLAVPEARQRQREDTAVAEVRVEFAAGPAIVKRLDRKNAAAGLIETGSRVREPLRAIHVRNLLRYPALAVNALYGQDQPPDWRPLPLATTTPNGVPLDIWRRRPAGHILTIPKKTEVLIPVRGRADRLWLALWTDGAYPVTPYGEDVAVLRVAYEDGGTSPEIRLANGRDLADAMQLAVRGRVAMQWVKPPGLPEHYTLHALPLDKNRVVTAVVVQDLGILSRLSIAALTLGRRTATTPPGSSRVKIDGDLLTLPDRVRERWRGTGLAVRAPNGATAVHGAQSGVRTSVELPFRDAGAGTLELWLPPGPFAALLQRNRAIVFGLATLLGAFAGVIAGAAALRRARHLRIKMLVALGAATVVPLVFLVASLTRTLNDRAERDLEEATRADLRTVIERVEAAKARARDLAYGARDTLDLVAAQEAPQPERLVPLLARVRADIEAQGGFLRVPGLDAALPAPLGNASFIDSTQRSGLYYSPWDGLLAVGLARTSRRHACIVGLRAPALAGARGDVDLVLFGPGGEPQAAPRGLPPALESRGARAAHGDLVRRIEKQGSASYVARAALRGHSVAAAHALLRDGGRLVGLVGVYRSRAETEAAKEATFRTIFLSSLAALLLVVIAGGTLVERVTDRLRRVTRAARALATGDLSSRVPVEQADEVARLAASFNAMADALDERVHQLTELQRGLHELTAALDREQVARVAAELLERATGASYVLVCATDQVSDRLETLHRRGDGAPLGRRLPESGPARDAIELRRTVVREGAVFLPLVAAGRAVGLALCSPVGEAGQLDRAFLDATGRQIGIALENARLYHAAVTDELTGLYTQVFFVRRLKEEVDRAAATERPLSVLRLVIQDFRRFARSHGAAAAAKLIAGTASVIEAVLPRRNFLGHRRPGELLALLVESDANAARRHLERIIAALARHDFGTADDERPRFSFRSVTYPRDGSSADVLLDTLFDLTESWEDTSTDMIAPMLTIPAELGAVLGRSPSMRSALDVVTRVAPTSATVLVSGETGAGKEVMADLIQANSDRRDGPYVKVNCAAIPETLLETELFGHEKGAFTGAERRRIGRFEEAHQGTLFLDEIGDVPKSLQVKLLRVLQERCIHRLGGTAPVPIDVRIITATNQRLLSMVERGDFREDLYHRLHVIELSVPSLRERREDIPGLVEHFRQQINREHQTSIEAFAPDALDSLYRHAWPGNVRELKNVIERSMLMASGATVQLPELTLKNESGQKKQAETPVHIEGLTPRQERVLAFARRNGGVSNGDVVREEDVSSRTALRELQKLVDRGLLHRVGRRRGAVYRPPKN